MDKGDQIICNHLKTGNRKGIDFLFEKYYVPLVYWSLTILQDLQEAEDTVQDFFVSLWEKGNPDHLRAETFKAYLFTAVRNNSLKRLSLKERNNRSFDQLRIEPEWEEYDLFKEESIEKVYREVESLPPRMKEVITLVYKEGRSYKETAGLLGITPATVNAIIVKALRKLRDVLDISDPGLLLHLIFRAKNLRSVNEC